MYTMKKMKSGGVNDEAEVETKNIAKVQEESYDKKERRFKNDRLSEGRKEG